MLFLKVFKVGDNFDSRLRRFHIVAPLYEKHFWPFADFRMGISKSDLVLTTFLKVNLIVCFSVHIKREVKDFMRENRKIVDHKYEHPLISVGGNKI